MNFDSANKLPLFSLPPEIAFYTNGSYVYGMTVQLGILLLVRADSTFTGHETEAQGAGQVVIGSQQLAGEESLCQPALARRHERSVRPMICVAGEHAALGTRGASMPERIGACRAQPVPPARPSAHVLERGPRERD